MSVSVKNSIFMKKELVHASLKKTKSTTKVSDHNHW